MGSCFTKNLPDTNEQYDLIVENILLKIPKNKVKIWKIRKDKDQVKGTLSRMRSNQSYSSFEGLIVQPYMLHEYIDDKYKHIFNCQKY
jgi:hypothetical protein